MNELKPEDVMRALECCHQSVYSCEDCPYFGTTKGNVACSELLAKDALALLREKDAEIKGLVDGWSKDQDRFEQVCTEKDAEIERLKSDFEKAQCSVELLGAELGKLGLALSHVEQIARAEAITEFAERLKKFYSHLKGNTVGGSVEYHIDQIVKEMKGE